MISSEKPRQTHRLSTAVGICKGHAAEVLDFAHAQGIPIPDPGCWGGGGGGLTTGRTSESHNWYAGQSFNPAPIPFLILNFKSPRIPRSVQFPYSSESKRNGKPGVDIGRATSGAGSEACIEAPG